MKKNIFILIILLCLFIVTPVKAENFKKFQIYTTFENVEKSEIPEVYIYYEVFGEDNLREAVLNQENDFKYLSSDIPKGNILFDSGYVKGDKLGNYDVVGEVTQNGDDEIYISIIVKNFEPTSMTTTKTTLTLPSSTTTQKVEKTEEKDTSSIKNMIAIIICSVLAGVILIAILIFIKKARESSNMY